uniref:Uncharacterized protein n=1 Tax=Panagrolaimus superbus TaxID=310955 RepID=A0A914Z3U4_9BILA
MDPRIYDDRIGGPIGSRSLLCSSEECRQCAAILAIRLRQIGLLQRSPTFSFPLPNFNQIQPNLCPRLRLSRTIPNLLPPPVVPSFVTQMVSAGLTRIPRDTTSRSSFGAAVAAAIQQARSVRGQPFFNVISRIRNQRIQNTGGNRRNQQNQGNSGGGGGGTRGISRPQQPQQQQQQNNQGPQPGNQFPQPFPTQQRPQQNTPNNFPNRVFPRPQQQRPQPQQPQQSFPVISRPIQQPPFQQFPQQPIFQPPIIQQPGGNGGQQPGFQPPFIQQPIFQQPGGDQQPIFQQPGGGQQQQQPPFFPISQNPQFPNGQSPQNPNGILSPQGPLANLQQPLGSAFTGLAQQGALQGFHQAVGAIPGLASGGGNPFGGSGGTGNGGSGGGGGFGGGAGAGGGGQQTPNPGSFGGGFSFGRKKRAVDDGILGDRFVISCVERGDTENEVSDFLNLCTACWTWRQLPPDYFPRLINELVCNENDYCLSGWGSCQQRYRNVDVLRRGPNGWQPTSISVATCCDCKVKAGTEVHALVIGKK